MHKMDIAASDRLANIHEYYFSVKLEEIREMNANGDAVLNLGIGSPDMPPSPAVGAALAKEAEKDSSHAYQSYKGIPELREAIGEYYENSYGVQLNPDDEILPLLGSKEGIAHISMAFLNPGDEVLVPDPGYPTYSAATHLAGAKPVVYSLDENNGWAINWEEIREIDLGKVRMMWVNYPNMPTGALGSEQLFEELVAFGKEQGILICHDNPYSRILNDQPLSALSIDGAKDIVLELNSLSKSHNMAGWRLGWVSGSANHIKTVLRYKSNIDSGMFLPIQRGGIAALQEGEEWFEALNAEYRKRRELVFKMLDSLGCKYSEEQSGLFVWASIGEVIAGSEAFCDNLLQEAKVFFAPGTIFGKNGEGYVRVSLCTSIEILSEAAKRLEKFVKT